MILTIFVKRFQMNEQSLAINYQCMMCDKGGIGIPSIIIHDGRDGLFIDFPSCGCKPNFETANFIPFAWISYYKGE